MKAKLTFLAGAALGYVLGTRAGRESYEKIKSAAKQTWAKDAVQDTVATVQESVKTQAGEVAHKLVEQVRPHDKQDPDSAKDDQDTTASSEKSLYGSGGNPLDIVSGVSDEFPDAGLNGGGGQGQTGAPRPVTG